MFCIKLDEKGKIAKYKARIVARGFSQRPGNYDQTYAPFLSKKGLHFLFAYAAEQNQRVHQIDIKTAFLYAKLDKDLYLDFSEGYHIKSFDKSTHILKLNKSINRLKQSSMLWKSMIKDFLIKELSFTPIKEEKCLYRRQKTNCYGLLGIYLDDILISSNSIKGIQNIKTKLANRFQTVDLGIAKYILGMEIEQKFLYRKISQSLYIDHVASKYKLLDVKSRRIPDLENEKLIKNENK
jgi:Reverse transcriptase (RNA-dependent DNA polymerase)